jgi:hypothetical protein
MQTVIATCRSCMQCACVKHLPAHQQRGNLLAHSVSAHQTQLKLPRTASRTSTVRCICFLKRLGGCLRRHKARFDSGMMLAFAWIDFMTLV